MAKKKDFNAGGSVPAPVIPIHTVGVEARYSSVRISILLPNGRVTVADFSSYLGFGFDETVYAISGVLAAMVTAGRPKPLTLETVVSSGLANWWRFCKELASQGNPPLLVNINLSLMESYIGWLSMRMKPDGERWSPNTARTVFNKTKTVLKELIRRKLVLETRIFPSNPFPGSTATRNRRNYIRPLSDDERERILRPLSLEVAQIFDGTHPGSLRTQLGLCAFAVLLKTGVNPTPFLEISRDLSRCFIDHPRINRKILVMFKGRAGVYTTTSIQPSETKVVSLDVYKLCQRVVELTEEEASDAIGTELEGRLWMFRKLDMTLRTLSTQELSSIAVNFAEKYQLLRDDGTRLKMSSQLFRNTKHNRIWRASNGDLLATSKSASNTPKVAERYLTVTPDMHEEHRLAGEVLVATLSDRNSYQSTPHSGCSDTINGELSPKNGTHCVDFLSCFRCKSQVITQDDLYKLYSFYWAVFDQRSNIGVDNWNKLFAWIVRIIDRDVAPKFNQRTVDLEKARARVEPHPMWRSANVLSALRSVV